MAMDWLANDAGRRIATPAARRSRVLFGRVCRHAASDVGRCWRRRLPKQELPFSAERRLSAWLQGDLGC